VADLSRLDEAFAASVIFVQRPEAAGIAMYA